MTGLLALSVVAWGIALTHYGNLGAQMHVLFYMTIPMVFCVMLMLRSAGCRLMQGYLFQKPMPQSKIGAFHRQPLGIVSAPAPTKPQGVLAPAGRVAGAG